MTNDCLCTWETPDGVEHSVTARIRTYLPTELALYMQQAGFVVEEMLAGDKPERRKIQFDEYVILVIARKARQVA